MAHDTPPPKDLPEPGYYYHFKHDPDGPLNNYAYYIYGVGHHTEDDCRTEDSFMQVYRPLYENSYAYRNGGLFDLRSAPHRSGRRGHRAVQRQSRTRHHAETPGQGRGGRRRDPVSGLRRHRRPVVRGRRYDCAVRNTPRADL